MQSNHVSVHTFSSAHRALAVACLATAVSIFTPVATLQAAVLSSGYVTPVDFIFSPIDEGLPPNGNFLDINQVGLDPFTGVITDFFNQITWEGYVSRAPDLANNDPGDNTNANVYVGASEFADVLPGTGSLQINSGSELRFMDLIIGGNTADPMLATPSAQGTVEITGPGSLYNSDFNLIPPEAVPLLNLGLTPTNGQISVNPRAGETGAELGFDLRLGVSPQSSGVLNITAGGVAEIHDSVVIGEADGAIGIVTVDGFGSVLQGGGNIAPVIAAGLNLDPHMMVIGRLGTGTLDITNGGRVIAKTFNDGTQGQGIPVYGAAIGDNPLFTGFGVAESPGVGGSGTVNVDGNGSLFSVSGGLLLGGFSQPNETPIIGDDDTDVEGDNVRYGSNAGDGTLNVRNGGLVAITTPATGGLTANVSVANLSIGRFGRLILDDGKVLVGNSNTRDENVVLTNDGLISGNGRIDTGIFRNRLLGEVRVGQDEKLIVVSTSGFIASDVMAVPVLEEQPLLNYGLIQVVGGEIEFLRAEDTANQNPGGSGVDPGDPQQFQAFRNAALTAQSPVNPNISRRVGEIKVNNSTLNFQTGLENQGQLIFYGGNDNILLGNVRNMREITVAEDADLAVPEGEILITGDETFVTFNGDFTNAGYMEVGPSATGFQIVGDFTTTNTSTTVSRINSTMNVLGDADLDGLFQIELPLPGLVEFDPQHGDVFPVFYASGGLTESLLFDVPFLGLTAGFIPLVDFLSGTISLLAFDVASTTNGDLNGDGVVDNDDIDIYAANRGNPGGLGDINMDGIVNALDLTIIFDAILAGGTPGTAAGSSVPEPASATLVLLALLAMAGPRRRR